MDILPRQGSAESSESVDFADIARLRDQSEPRTRPLYIHFTF
jgi:hypothetical protein